MNAKDVLVAIGVEGTQKDRKDTKKDLKGKERDKKDHSSNYDNVKPKNDKTRRMVKFKTLVMPVDKILMQIKDKHPLKRLKLLNSSPNARNKKKYYHFHRDHRHYTYKCRDLKEQIEELI